MTSRSWSIGAGENIFRTDYDLYVRCVVNSPTATRVLSGSNDCAKIPPRFAAMTVKTQATIEDLYHVDGKAELVNGEILHMPPTGAWPGRAAGAIYLSLSSHE